MHKRDLFAKGIRATEWPLEKGEKLQLKIESGDKCSVSKNRTLIVNATYFLT